MGGLAAQGFADAVGEGHCSLETALRWHLQSNHYPPLPLGLLPVCVAAIDAAIAGDWDNDIELPDGITWRGSSSAPVHAVIEAHHLEAFLT